MTQPFDLIVLGAGPAGASAAMTARQAGLRVALVDRAQFPRDKLCGGGVSGRARRHLAAVFGDLSEDLFQPCAHVRLVDQGRVIGDLPDAPPVWMTMRRPFDAALQAAAVAAGAEPFSGQRVTAIDPQGQVTLADGLVLHAPVVLGCDGVNSAVARAIWGRAHDPARIGFGLETEAAPQPGPPVMELDLGAAAWGYGWAFPKPGSLTVGVGGLHPKNPDMQAAMAAYLARHGVAGARVKGHFLPFGDVRRVPGRGRLLVAGDAAGLVDPITGEGIAWAVKSGQLAAQAVAAGPDGALARYAHALRPVQAELALARRLRALAYHPWLQPAFLRLLAREPRLQRRFLAILAGDADYADLGWRALPRVAWRLLGRDWAKVP